MRPAVERLERGAEFIALVLHWIGIWIFLPLLMSLVTADVVFRYIFRSSLQGATEVGTLLLLVVFFASLPHCTFRHGHVYMELVYVRLSGWRRTAADLLTAVCGLAFAGMFAWQAAFTLRDYYKYGDGGELIDISFWPFAAIIFVCGLLFAVAMAFQLLRVILAMPIEREKILHD